MNFILDRAGLESSRKLILLPIGKLTNIALALLKDRPLNKKKIIIWENFDRDKII